MRRRTDYGIILAHVFGWSVALAALTLAVLAWAAMARAHQAPSGWAYDVECCHTMDCAPVPDGAIRETHGGYVVTLRAGDHPMVSDGGLVATVPHGDPRIRVSGDEHRHACVSTGGRLLCIYVPPGGV